MARRSLHLLDHRDSLIDVTLPSVAVVISEGNSLTWFDSGGMRGARRARGAGTLQREKTNKNKQTKRRRRRRKQHKNYQARTWQLRVGPPGAPDDGPRATLHPRRRPQTAVVSQRSGSVGFCRAIQNHRPPLQRAGGAEFMASGHKEVSQTAAFGPTVFWCVQGLTRPSVLLTHLNMTHGESSWLAVWPGISVVASSFFFPSLSLSIPVIFTSCQSVITFFFFFFLLHISSWVHFRICQQRAKRGNQKNKAKA